MSTFAAMERRVNAGIIAKIGNADLAIPALGFQATGVFVPKRPDALDGMVQATGDLIQINQADMTPAAKQHLESGGQLRIDGVAHIVRHMTEPVDGFYELPVKAV